MSSDFWVLAAEGDQLPEDVGKAGPLGLLLIVLLLIATALLVRSMNRQLKKVNFVEQPLDGPGDDDATPTPDPEQRPTD